MISLRYFLDLIQEYDHTQEQDFNVQILRTNNIHILVVEIPTLRVEYKQKGHNEHKESESPEKEEGQRENERQWDFRLLSIRKLGIWSHFWGEAGI